MANILYTVLYIMYVCIYIYIYIYVYVCVIVASSNNIGAVLHLMPLPTQAALPSC